MKRDIRAFVMLLLFAAPAAVQAQFTYSTNADNTLTVTGYYGPPWTITIPTNVNGMTVTSIGGGAFYQNTSLTGITIPGTIISIMADSFQSCLGLTSITIPASVNFIGDEAFNGCVNLTNVFFEGDAPNDNTYPLDGDINATVYYSPCSIGWSSIYSGAPAVPNTFSYTTNDSTITIAGCSGLCGSENVTLPANFNGLPVTSIGTNALESLTNLTTMTIPGSITNIGSHAFENCASLTSAYFNSNAPAADATLFDYDTNVTVYHPFGAAGWGSTFGGVPAVSETDPSKFSYSQGTVTGYSGFGGAINIPASIGGAPVVLLGNNAFAFTSLTSVTIPNSVSDIGQEAFGFCLNLTNVTLSDTIVSIEPLVFEDCASLGSIMIPANVEIIDDSAFSQCTRLASVYFQGNAPGVDASAFNGDTNVTAYYFPGTSGWAEFSAETGIPAVPWWQVLLSYTTNAGALTITGSPGLGGTAILSLPASITGLPVTSIGANAFENLSNLTSLTIPACVTNIGADAFAGYTNLTNIYFNGNAPTADPTAFNDDRVTVYYFPCAIGWSSTFAGVPAEALPVQDMFSYTTNAGAITITGSLGGCDPLPIPSTINGLPVTSIGSNAFENLTSLMSVTIPGSVTSIGDAAFAYCMGLTNVTIPQGVTSFGQGAFYGCSDLASVTIPASVTNMGEYAFQLCNRLTNVTFANGVTGIGEYAFDGCGGLTSITFPPSVTTIGEYSFASCTNLASVTIPGSVNTIWDDAFAFCPKLTEVTIPSSVTSIGYGLFIDSSNLTNVYFQGNAPALVGFPIDSPAFSGDSNVTVYYSPCTTGWSSTFAGVSAVPEGLVYATNASAITITGYSSLCPNVIIPASINGLPVGSIGASAFENLTHLTSVTLTSITNIGAEAFEGCSGLTGVYFNGNAPAADVSSFNNDITATVYYTPCATGWTNTFAGLPTVPETTPDQFSYTINAGAITITGYSGSCGTLIVPAAIDGLPVTTIESNAFENLTNLASVTIPGSVTSIGEAAFAYCAGLTNMTISPGINSIGQGAFYGCSSLSGVTIPASVTNIGEYAFQLCNRLTNVALANGVTSIGEYAFYGSSLTSVTIPASVTNIGQDAFADCAGLTTVTIPSRVNTIGDDAFAWCSGLISVTLPASVTNIGYALFDGSSNLTSVYFQGDAPVVVGNSYDGAVFDGDASVTVYYSFCTFGWGSTFAGVSAVPEGLSFTTNAGAITVTGYSSLCPYVIISASINGLPVTSIGANAFANLTNLTSVAIPAGVTNIGANAFAGSSSLTSVYFNGNAPVADATVFNADTQGAVYYAPCASGWSNTFAGLPAIPGTAPDQFIYTINAGAITLTGYSSSCSVVNIPATIEGVPVTGIGYKAFYGQNSVTSVTIPGTVTSISGIAFYGCTHLSSVTLSNGVTGIEAYAFQECPSLTSLTLPASVTQVDSNTFMGTSLTNISFLGNVTIGPNAFSWGSLTSVHIAGGSIGAYAFQNCTNLTHVTFGNGLTSIADTAFSDDPISSLYIPGSVTDIRGAAFSCPGLTNVIFGAGVASIDDQAFDQDYELTNVLFLGNAPVVVNSGDQSVFAFSPTTVYYLPGTTGWSNTFGSSIYFAGAPTVLWNPVIQANGANFGLSNNQFGFNITGTANIPIVVEGCTNLANPVWMPLTNVALTNGLFHFSEPCQANTPGRYYRIGWP